MTMSIKDKEIKRLIDDESVIKRFKSYLEVQPDGCIEWTGFRTDKGYGLFGISQGIPVKAHRFGYALYYGADKLPHGTDKTQKRKVLHHKCENKACVNPLHLEIVSDRFNLGRVNDKDMF
jgi:hypothetical protein